MQSVPYQTQIFAEGRLIELVHDELDLGHGCVVQATARSQTDLVLWFLCSSEAQCLGKDWIFGQGAPHQKCLCPVSLLSSDLSSLSGLGVGVFGYAAGFKQNLRYSAAFRFGE